MTDTKYIGNELLLFKNAHNWKSYYAKKLKPYIKGEVIEVGAGLGGTTEFLINPSVQKWVCLEPDAELASQINFSDSENNSKCSVTTAFLNELPSQEKFDTIIYIDVLEHIEKDNEELLIAAEHLKDGGNIIVLSPAFQSLFSPFDKAIGHYRRYTKYSLSNVVPSTLIIVKAGYLDSLGYFLSMSNRMFLKQSYPTEQQIKFWDKYILSVSKFTDLLLAKFFGRSVYIIAQKYGSDN